MLIEYGIRSDGELIYIDQVPRGPTHVTCPYCGGPLLARKGQAMTPHFAHAGRTCRPGGRAQDIIVLPAYDNFNLHLPSAALTLLGEFRAIWGMPSAGPCLPA
jgi:hypothetical protein